MGPQRSTHDGDTFSLVNGLASFERSSQAPKVVHNFAYSRDFFLFLKNCRPNVRSTLLPPHPLGSDTQSSSIHENYHQRCIRISVRSDINGRPAPSSFFLGEKVSLHMRSDFQIILGAPPTNLPVGEEWIKA